MKIIKSVAEIITNSDGETVNTLRPEYAIPANAIKVVCDGENYIVYEEGDVV